MRRVGIEIEYNIPPSVGMETACRRAAKASGWGFHSSFHRLRRYKAPKDKTKVWVLKSDGSCLTEVNTPATGDLRSLQKGLYVLEKELPSIWPYTNGVNCGLHVHVDLRFKGKEGEGRNFLKLAKLVIHFLHWQDVFYSLQPRNRFDSDFCIPMEDMGDPSNWRALESIRKEVRRNPEVREDCWGRGPGYYFLSENFEESTLSERYLGLSLVRLEKYGTAEFRMGASTLSAVDILYWTELCRSFVDRAWGTNKTGLNRKLSSFLRFIRAPKYLRDWAMEKQEIYKRYEALGED